MIECYCFSPLDAPLFLRAAYGDKEVSEMSKVCDVCKKGKVFGKSVSHSHKTSNRSWEPNLRKVKAIVDGVPKTIRVCSRCLRSGKVQRAL
jgi:large subunit ribosomal protein L28